MCCLWNVETFALHFVKIFKKCDIKIWLDLIFWVVIFEVFFLEFLSNIVWLILSIRFRQEMPDGVMVAQRILTPFV